MRRITAIDMPLFLCILILVGLGITFIYSASYPQALASSEDSFYYTSRQILFALAAGLPAMLICTVFPLQVFYRHPARKWFIWGIIVIVGALMIAVLFMPDKHGNRAWLPTPLGPIQPSEFAKVAVILLLAAYLCRRPWMVKSLKGLAYGPLWFVIIPIGLIVAQKDLGTAFVVTLALAITLVIAGARARYIVIPMLGVVLLMMGIVMSGHRVGRIDAWLNPEKNPNQEGFQTLHSLIAIGSGGLFGRGFCQSREKWSYLPAAKNDSILAVIAEELGLILTVMTVFAPFMLLVFRGFSIAHRAPDEFGALVAIGCTVMLATQAMINMAVSLNVIPMMGVNLPFISSGGSSLIASMMMGGLLLNISSMRPVNHHVGESAQARQPVAG